MYRGEYDPRIDAVDDGRVSAPEGDGLDVDHDWSFVEANELRRVRTE